MKARKELPSNLRNIVDEESGMMYSKRDTTTVSSMVNPASSLVKFGIDHYEKYLDTDYFLMTYEYPNRGSGYIVYEVKDTGICMIDIYADCVSEKEKFNCYEALIETVFNICKSSNKALEFDIEDKDLEIYINRNNQSYKEQKVEDKYWWKIQ